VSAARARGRNPERREGSPDTMGRVHILSEAVANEIAAGKVEALYGRERSGSPQPKSRAQRGIS